MWGGFIGGGDGISREGEGLNIQNSIECNDSADSKPFHSSKDYELINNRSGFHDDDDGMNDNVNGQKK